MLSSASSRSLLVTPSSFARSITFNRPAKASLLYPTSRLSEFPARRPCRQHRRCAFSRRLRRPPERVVEPPLPERAHQALENRTRIGATPRARPARVPVLAAASAEIQDRAPVSTPRQPDQLRLRPDPPTAQAGPTRRGLLHPASARGPSSTPPWSAGAASTIASSAPSSASVMGGCSA